MEYHHHQKYETKFGVLTANGKEIYVVVFTIVVHVCFFKYKIFNLATTVFALF